MIYQEIRKKAKKKVEAKKAFYICSVVFFFVSIVLLMLSFYMPSIGFWLKLPIPIFMMVLGVLYISAFGLPTAGKFSTDWEEEEIQKEIVKLYRKKRNELPSLEAANESEILELKELERLKEKLGIDDEYV